MNLKAFLRGWSRHRPSIPITHTHYRFQPVLELLEDRLAPATFTVNSTLDTDDGLPLNATTTLRKAIRLANADAVADTINFATALMDQTITLSGTELAITKPVAIVGPSLARITIDANNASRIFNINDGTGASIAVSLSGVQLMHGNSADGGAIFNTETLTVAASSLDNNSATNNGAAINNSGTLTVTNSTFSANAASVYGGGIYGNGTLNVTNSTFTGGSAQYGGGIFLFNGTLALANSMLSGNSVTNFGGGVYVSGGTATVTSSTFTANSASFGGGAYNSSTMTLATSTLANNSALNDGGGIGNSGTLTLASSTLTANSAGAGGGVDNTASLTVTNSTIANNSAQNDGGGIDNTAGTATLTNCTVVANRADNNGDAAGIGGGIHNAATATLFNTIVAGNVKGTGAGTPNDLAGTNLTASTFNLIGDPLSRGGLTNGAGGNIVGKNAGAQLLPLSEILDPTLRNNGGPTRTYALIPSSAALNAGDNSKAAAIPFDQRGTGFNRIVADQVDIGAFEMPRATFTDDFARASSPSLGPPWVSQAGALGIVSGLAQGTGTTTMHVATVAGVTAADLDLYATIQLAVNQDAGLVARYSGAGDNNYYLASLTRDAAGNVSTRLVRNVNGTVSELAVVEDVVPNVGSTIHATLRFRLVGSTLQLFLNGSLLATAVDISFKSGLFGMRSTGMGSLDNFQAYPITTGVDNFDLFTQPDYVTLSDPWSQPVGFFRTLGNQIQGGEGLNLAVLSAVNQADVDVQATVSLTGLNFNVGLLARYQGTGDANYYLAKLTRTSTGFTAALVRNIAGTATSLATATIPSSTGKATLRFVVTGFNLRMFVNNILVLNFLETSLVSGSVGIRTDLYSTVDNFRAAAVTTSLPFTDNFDQPDGRGLGINWTRRIGDFQVVGNKATGLNPVPAVNLATLVGVKPANVEIQATLTLNTSDEIGLIACQNGTTDANYYMARVVKTASGYSLSIIKNISGTVTLLTLTDVATLTGPIKFRLEGASLKLFMNNVLMLSTSDSSFISGNVGIRSIGSGTIDNFSATAVNFLPFSDNFDPDALNVNWSPRAGGYSLTTVADKAKGTASLNVMTMRRMDLSDVDVQADINVPTTANEFAGLFARYAGPADDNMYQATITYNGTQFVASIAKKVSGTTTPLASVNVGTGAGTLRFTAIGGQLTLYFNGTKLLSAYDFTLTGGSAGIRSSLNPTFDNFSANQAN